MFKAIDGLLPDEAITEKPWLNPGNGQAQARPAQRQSVWASVRRRVVAVWALPAKEARR